MADIPTPEVLERVAKICGAAVKEAMPVLGGFTEAARCVAILADGRTCFVKAATSDATAGWLRREHIVYSGVKARFVARMLGWDDDGSRPVLVLEDLSRAPWPPPWTREPIRRLRATLDEVAATTPPEGLPRLEDMRAELSGWSTVAADAGPFLSLGLCTPAWLDSVLPTFRAAERIVVLDGPDLVHLDVRSDNVCFPEDRVVLVDWNWACRGNGRVDLAFWAPSLLAEGGPPPEEICPGPPELAATVAGYFAARAGLPAGEIPLRVRNVQKVQLRAALPWAARAMGLPAPDGTAQGGSTGDTKKKEEWIF